MKRSLSDYPCPPAPALTVDRLWQDARFPEPPMPGFRLAQGPFGIVGDDGWRLAGSTCVNASYYPNPGMGFVAYAWEEGGPSLAARAGDQTLKAHLEDLLALPFCDVLYIRCDWRDVQSEPGRLNMIPIWRLALDACREHGKRLAFRVQMSTTVGQPGRLAMPDFLQAIVPAINIGPGRQGKPEGGYLEPQYDHPAFIAAVTELCELLAKELDGEPLLEFVDLMMFGFWGEGHTGNCPNPIPFVQCEKLFLHLTEMQRTLFAQTPLCVNIQTDISRAGNRAVQEHALRHHMYLRTDSIMWNEPQANEMVAHRPPHIPAVVEDGTYRTYDMQSGWFTDASPYSDSKNTIDNTLLHALDLGANYLALWTEGANVARYNEACPSTFEQLRARLGYRVRPSWIYQRKRFGGHELVLMLHNDGVASIPGHLMLSLRDAEGQVLVEGCLDAGQPFAGRTRQCGFMLPEGFAGGEVYLYAYLCDQKGKRPVRFACRNGATLITGVPEHSAPCVIRDNTPLREEGFRIPLSGYDADDWRKDI